MIRGDFESTVMQLEWDEDRDARRYGDSVLDVDVETEEDDEI